MLCIIQDIMKLQETERGQYFLTVPKAIALANGWKKGTGLDLILNPRGEWVLKQSSAS